MSIPNFKSSVSVAIAAGASLSAAGLKAGWRLVGYITDAAWDTQAVSFQASRDGTNYFSVYNEAAEYTQAGVTASTYHAVNPAVFEGANYIKVRSGVAANAVNQVDATSVTLVLAK
jgi:hypothetical protein